MATATADPKAPKTSKKTVKQEIEDAALASVSVPLRKLLIEQMVKATPGLNGQPTTIPKPAKDPKVEAIEKVFFKNEGNFRHDSDRQILGQLMSALLGAKVEVTKAKNASKTVPFMAVVSLDNSNGHSYQLGSPVMFRNNGGSTVFEVVKGKGRSSGNINVEDMYDSTKLRFATQAEVEEYATKLVSSFENIQALRRWMGSALDTLLDK